MPLLLFLVALFALATDHADIAFFAVVGMLLTD